MLSHPSNDVWQAGVNSAKCRYMLQRLPSHAHTTHERLHLEGSAPHRDRVTRFVLDRYCYICAPLSITSGTLLSALRPIGRAKTSGMRSWSWTPTPSHRHHLRVYRRRHGLRRPGNLRVRSVHWIEATGNCQNAIVLIIRREAVASPS
jgi:hypothetical protein